MTYCLGIKIKQGLVGIADSRITSGNETTTSKKIFTLNRNQHSLFIMTSGLRSVRDKAITYFNEVISEQDSDFNKLYKAVNAFAEQVRRVSREDRPSLEESGLQFNLHAIVGGQLEDDDEHKLYLLYPQGNWIEVGQSTPYVIIGNTGYGKPILDRLINFESSFESALRAGFLSFDATRVSASDVGFPMDVVLYQDCCYDLVEQRYQVDELRHISKIWGGLVKDAAEKLPGEWIKNLMETAGNRRLENA